MSVLAPGTRKSCYKCGREAEVMVRYARLYLCREHYIEYIEERIMKTIERYGLLSGVKRLLIALSGGKDSLSLAYVLSRNKEKIGLTEIIGLHIDLGINGYSEESRESVEKACSELGMKCFILSLKDLLGLSLPEITRKSNRPPCSICGLIKRYIINTASIELGVDAVAMGHHMDDILLFYLRNFLLGVKSDYLKLGPVIEAKDTIVAKKLRPLYEVYEEDLSLYAKLRGIRTVGTECPFKHDDHIEKAIKEMLDKLENHAPGYKLSLLRRITFSEKHEALSLREVFTCKYCGSPTNNKDNICALCKLTQHVFGEPRGLYMKQKLKEFLQ